MFFNIHKKKFGKIVKDASKKVKNNYENLCFQLEKKTLKQHFFDNHVF